VSPLLRKAPPPRWPRLHRWQRFLVPLGALTVTVALAATVVRVRRRRADLAAAQVPDVIRGDRPAWQAGPRRVDVTPPAPLLLPAPAAALGEELVETEDDRDTRGAGLPVPASQAAEELREENRFEMAVFVRSTLILVAIALLLTARTIWVG